MVVAPDPDGAPVPRCWERAPLDPHTRWRWEEGTAVAVGPDRGKGTGRPG